MSTKAIDPDLPGNAAGRRRLIAIVYADMVGYSRLISMDDAGTMRRLRTLRRALIDPAIREHGGKIVHTGGDSLLVVFDNIDGAVRCAAKVQQQVPAYDGDQPPNRRIRFRVGINTGDALSDGTDLHGEGVNIAARLEAACPPGGLCVSRAVRDQVLSRLDLDFESLGSLTLKNIPHPVEAYVVRLDTTPSGPTRRVRAKLFAGLAGLLIATLGTGWWLYIGTGWLHRETGTIPGASQVPPTSPSPNTQTGALQSVGLPNAPTLSLAVLPFENTGDVTADSYLALGVTDDLTTELSHIPGAFVISRATAYTYRGKAEDIRRIGRDLGVRYVVQGSVQRLGQVLRIDAELGSTETGVQLWSDAFNLPIDDLARAQEQIVIRMRSALDISLMDIETARSLRERPTNPNAFDLILRARAAMLLPATKDTQAQALSYLDEALQRDPDSVLALSLAAWAVLNENFLDMLPYDVAVDRATQYLERARKLQPNAETVLDAQAHLLDWQGDGLDYKRAHEELEAAAERLIEYYPNDPTGFFTLGVLRRQQARYDEAATLFATMIRINPRGAGIKNSYWNMAYCNVWGGHDQEALKWADRATAAAGSLPVYREQYLLVIRAVAYFRSGDVETAKRLSAELNGAFPFYTWRWHSPDDPDSETNRQQTIGFRNAMKGAGARDHLDPDADFGVAPDDVLHKYLQDKTPKTAPRA